MVMNNFRLNHIYSHHLIIAPIRMHLKWIGHHFSSYHIKFALFAFGLIDHINPFIAIVNCSVLSCQSKTTDAIVTKSVLVSDVQLNSLHKSQYRLLNRQNRLRFVYTQFKSSDQSLDKTSFDFFNMFRAMKSCVMNAKSRIILKRPKSMVTWL